MTHSKNLGIFMDHANANLIEYPSDATEIKTVSSKFTHLEKEETLNKSELLMHNKEQHEEGAYYKSLAAVILKYERVLLFGITQAKLELQNILQADHRFDKIEIVVKDTNKMTGNQQHAFVKEFFGHVYEMKK